jgi:hypothetical protein
MATSAKKSVPSTAAKKSYGSGTGPGKTPAASGQGMDKNAQSDHDRMTTPAQQQGRYQAPQPPQAPLAPQAPQTPQASLQSDPFISDLTQGQ